MVTNTVAADRAALPAQSVELAGALASHASSLLELKAWTDAEPVLRESLAIREAKEPNAWSAANTRSMLGRALLGQSNFSGAEPLLVAGYQGMKEREEKIPAPGKVRLTEALAALVELYTAWEKPEEAARWQKELESRKEADNKPPP